MLGAHAYINRARKREGVIRGYELMELVLETFRTFPSLPFDHAAADVYESLRTLKLRIGTMDLRIASIAVAKQCTLLTRNIADFGSVPGLTVED
ncbi:MAG: type II toxin-antitoxin system VapC family toxin [Pirellulaceae bacterium]